ncbi:helix-turn-helix domain-containing protein [Peristeroidobacter soli]|jgi:HTH-type transcriptional regulator/antitoxin HipB|uniref:helix-turn-helix domain-containing protein n=1 Tax=Peristeroidobacter soli TaxID=2497877 RepID=UPI00101D7419|nr:helix-turn-helix domain-containing protein [Peristeroidobacter soli]
MDVVARTPAQLGAALKSARIRRGLSQTEAASSVGVKQKTVSSLENIGAKTSVETLYKMLSALGLELVIRDNNHGDVPARDQSSREW